MLIGLTGAAGAGKDSVAEILQAAGWRRMAFADELRWEVSDAWGVDETTLSARATKEVPTLALCVGRGRHPMWMKHAAAQGWDFLQPRSPRWLMQQWGQWRRLSDPDYWVRPVRAWIHRQHQLGRNLLVVPDVRMPNEAAMLRTMAGRIVRVHRPDAAPLAADTASHESERHAGLGADVDLHNDGTLDHLRNETQRVLEVLVNPPAHPLMRVV